MKADNFGALFHGLPSQLANSAKIELRVGVSVFKLNSSNSQIAHASPFSDSGGIGIVTGRLGLLSVC